MKLFSTSKTWVRSVLLSAFACSSAIAWAETTVRFQDYPGTGLLLVRVAQAQGFCEKAGLKCELKTIPAAPLGLQTMLAGDIDVAYGPTEVAASAAARKLPIKVIGAGFVDPVFFLVAGAKVQLPNEGKPYPAVVADFKGKKIGVTQRGSGAEIQVTDMLAQAGLTASDVTYVAVGAPNTAFPALTNGQVDLVMSFSPMDGLCDVLKACRIVVDPRIGEGSPKVLATRGGAGALMVKADWAEANLETVAAIRKMLALAEAYTQDPANFSNVLTILKATFGLTMPKADEIAEATLKRGITTFHAQGKVPAMQAVADYMFENKQLPSRPDMASIVLP